MGLHVLIIENRDILREGLRSIFSGVPEVIQISETTSWENFKRGLVTEQPDMIIINQTLVTNFELLPRKHFSVIAATLSRNLLSAAYMSGACGYFSERVSGELLRAALNLTGEDFLLDPEFTTQLLLWFHLGSSQIDFFKDLTNREREVFGLLKEGLTNRSIAEQLKITEATVKTHVTNTLQKLGMKRRQVKTLI